jgi:uncharacterized membrane protein
MYKKPAAFHTPVASNYLSSGLSGSGVNLMRHFSLDDCRSGTRRLEMEKDALLLAGTIAGFVAAVLSIMEKLLDLKQRFRPGEELEESITRVAPAVAHESRPRRAQRAWKLINVSSYLLLHELTVIVAAGVLLNYFGLMLSLRLQSILYLDMVGTALAALLLGPWWGALTALLSSALVNLVLYPGPGADVVIFPWVLVNMTGGFFWGFLARRAAFHRYVKTPRTSALSHASYLVTFGVLGAAVMSVPGTFIQAALSEPTVLALNPDVAQALHSMILTWQESIQGQFEAFFGVTGGESAGWATVSWIQNCLRYIPDKTISVAIALTLIKYGFPLFERELIHGGQGKAPLRDTAAAPLILAAVYGPCFFVLVLADQYTGGVYWPVWGAPWLLILGGMVALNRWGPSDGSVRNACLARAERYAQALRPVHREPAHDFGQRLTVATLMASLIFALSLPLVLTDFYQVAFNFFCVVYGFLVAVYLIRVGIAQNISIARVGK